MQLTADQELRKEFLLFALNKQPDVESAMEMAAAMERFVLDGRRGSGPALQGAGASAAEGEQPAASGTGDTAASAEEVEAVVRKRRWSDADDVELKRLWHSDISLEELADRLDRTVPSLYSRARALGMSKRNDKPARPQEFDAVRPVPAGAKGDVMPDEGAARAVPQPDLAAVAGSGRPAPREECRISSLSEAKTAVATQRGFTRPPAAGAAKPAAAEAVQESQVHVFVDPIIQFLRSRDYSVVRVGEGQFRVDGRRVMNADELRQKANQVRKSLGQPLFATQLGERVG